MREQELYQKLLVGKATKNDRALLKWLNQRRINEHKATKEAQKISQEQVPTQEVGSICQYWGHQSPRRS